MLASLFFLPALALALPSQFEKRDGASISHSIDYINGNITTLNNTLNTFNKDKDAITAFTIQIQATDVTKSVDNAASTAKMSAPLSDTESAAVAGKVLNLQPNINSLLDNLVKHKPQFDTALFGFSASPLVVNTLKQAKNASDTFGKDLTPKLSGVYQQAAPVVIMQIDEKFDQTIAKFQS